MIAFLLLKKIAELFIIMLIGYIIVKKGFLQSQDSVVLSKLSLYILMPCVILNSFNVQLTAEIRNGLILAFIAAVIIHFILLFIDFLYKKIGKAGPVERASVMYSNAGNLIIPIVISVLGKEWVIYSCAFLSVQLIFIWSHGIRLFDNTGKFDIRKILFNINIITIIVGFLMLIFGLNLPVLISNVTNSLGSMIGTIGMLICGMVAAKMDIKSIITNKKVYPVLFLRMIFCPIVVLAVIKLTHAEDFIVNGDKILLITFLAAMTPAAATVTQFAQIHNKEPELAGAINIMTTIICILTMPLFVELYSLI